MSNDDNATTVRSAETTRTRLRRLLYGEVNIALPEFDIDLSGSLDVDLGGSIEIDLPEFDLDAPAPSPAVPTPFPDHETQ